MVAPRGLGLFERDPRVRGTPDQAAAFIRMSRFSWVSVDAGAAPISDVVRYGARIECPTWVHMKEEAFRPERWRASLQRVLSVAESIGARGIIVDPEGGWGGASLNDEARIFGREIGRLADDGWDIALTSYPMWSKLEEFAQGLGGSGIWGIPQFYWKDRPLSSYEGWIQRWKENVPGPIVPAISGWLSHTNITEDRFKAQLDTIGTHRGAVVWITPGGPRSDLINRVLDDYNPSGLPKWVDEALMALEGILNVDATLAGATAGGIIVASLLGFALLGNR